MREIWKSINQYEGLYEISNHGKVRSLTMRTSHPGSKIKKLNTPRILKPQMTRKRLFIVLYDASRNRLSRKTFRISRLVLDTFVGPCPTGFEASHLNGNSLDNRVDNLIWETHKKNNARKFFHGTAQIGDRHGMAKLTSKQVLEIRRIYSDGNLSQRELANNFGVHRSTIKNITSCKNWTHLR